MGTDLGTIDVPHGSAVIDVRGGDGFDVALFLRGQAVALSWLDCKGSVAQYLAWSGRTDVASDLAAVRDALGGEDAERVIDLPDLQPVLDLFARGATNSSTPPPRPTPTVSNTTRRASLRIAGAATIRTSARS